MFQQTFLYTVAIPQNQLLISSSLSLNYFSFIEMLYEVLLCKTVIKCYIRRFILIHVP